MDYTIYLFLLVMHLKKYVLLCFFAYLLVIGAFCMFSEKAALCISGVIFAFFAAYLFVGRADIKAKILFSVIFIVIIAGCGYRFDERLHFPKEFLSEDAILSGKILSAAENDGNITYVMDVSSVQCEGEMTDKVNTKVRISVFNAEKPPYAYGSEVSIKCSPGYVKNSAGYESDNFGYLMSKGIYVFAEADEKDIHYNGSDVNLFDFTDIANMIRIKSEEAIDTCYGYDTDILALVKGIMLSDKSDASEDLSEDIKIAGISHICAASGMHASYIFAFVMLICSMLGLKKKPTYIICVIMMFLYAATEQNASSVRAAVMVSISLVSFLVSRDEVRPWTAIITAFVMLAVNPLYVYDEGFMLSVASVMGILLFYGYFKNFCDRFSNRIVKNAVSAAIVCLCAQVFSFPLIMYYHSYVSIYSVAANVLITWAVPFVMAGGAICSALFYVSSPIAVFVSRIFAFFPWFIKKVCAGISMLPFARTYITTPDTGDVLIWIFAAVTIYFILQKKDSFARQTACGLVCILIISTVITGAQSCFSRVHFVNVGEGDCSLIQTVDEVNVLTDGGGSSAQSSVDIGKSITVPYLLENGVKKLDAAILSHYDKDHAQGIIYVLKKLKVTNMIIPKRDANYKNAYREEIINLCRQKEINLIEVSDGDHLDFGAVLSIDVISAGNISDYDDENNNSLVAAVKTDGVNILYTGDIEKKAEMKLAGKEKVKTDILKAAHHGSDTSSSEEFIRYAAPSTAVISCRANGYHPSEKTTDVLDKYGVKTYITGNDGNVKFFVFGKSFFKLF